MAHRSIYDWVHVLQGQSGDTGYAGAKSLSYPARADLASGDMDFYADRHESGISIDHGIVLLSAWNDAGAELGNFPVQCIYFQWNAFYGAGRIYSLWNYVSRQRRCDYGDAFYRLRIQYELYQYVHILSVRPHVPGDAGAPDVHHPDKNEMDGGRIWNPDSAAVF